MPRILLTCGPDDWQKLLAKPEKQWRTGYSARTLAHCWEAADGFPPEVFKALRNTNDSLLAGLVSVLATPEFKVPIPGGGHPSENDVFVVGKSSAGPVCIMVEGKVNESFGPTLAEWKVNASPGKLERLGFLLRTLCVPEPPGRVRYQFLHRAASAITTAEQYRSVAAVMLVHSFSVQRTGWQDYEDFVGLFGIQAQPETVQRLTTHAAVHFLASWVTGDCSFLNT
jgi:hypothetical protein